MSASNAGSAGFKNIRAMFENKANDKSQSPPSRGRSPNEQQSPSKERPLSKVRASFVPVENLLEEAQLQKKAPNLVHNTMDGSSDTKAVDETGLGGILKGSPFIDDGRFQIDEKPQSGSNGTVNRAAAMVSRMNEQNPQKPPVGDFIDKNHGPAIMPIGPAHPKTKEQAATSPYPSNAEETPKQARGPMIKPKGGASKISGIMESARQAREAGQGPDAESKPTETSQVGSLAKTANGTREERNPNDPDVKLKNNASRPSHPPESKVKSRDQRSTALELAPKPTTIPTSASVRPARSSLPSRKLPSATTASRESLAAKTEEVKPVTFKPSEKRATKTLPRVANVTTTSSLAKKSSRASLNHNEAAKPKSTVRQADEGFLARMMRPTASSAQKTHEKVLPPSPPRAKQTTGKTLISKPSGKSSNARSENKENEDGEPPEFGMQPKGKVVSQSAQLQQAEVASST